MADLYGARRGRDILFGAKDAFNPSQSRGQPGNAGEFGPGGGGGGATKTQVGKHQIVQHPPSAAPAGGAGGAAGGIAGNTKPGVAVHGPEAAKEWRDAVVKVSPIKTIDDLLASSAKNQVVLAQAAEEIARIAGTKFKNPGPKERDRLEEKLARPGRTPAAITDAARGGFNVRTPKQANIIAEEFAKRFQIADEGWAVTNVGYFDRKLMIRFPNNQIGEIQLWEPSLLYAKEKQGGHDHYKVWQSLKPTDTAGLAREEDAMRAIYQPVLDRLPADWNAVTGKGGSAPNAAANRSGVKM